MKLMKKTLAFVLALVMLFALCAPVMAAPAEGKDDNVFHYVSLGASNTNGYALHGYLTEEMYANPVLSGAQTGTPGDISGYRSTPEGSYPALVRDYFINQGYEVDHDQLAQSSMRVEELRFLLDESFTTDEYMQWRFYDPHDSWTWWYSTLDELRADYKQSISEADLITYDMGLNNFGVYLTNQIMTGQYGNDLHYVIGDEYADKFYSMRADVENALISLGIDGSIFETIDDLIDTIAYALLGYCINFDATMGIIRDWNPDATIVVLNVQNIMAGLDASIAGITLPFGEIIGVAAKLANVYTSMLSPYKDEYLYADVTENGRVTCFLDQLLAYDGDPASLDLDMRDCMDAYDTALPMYLRFRVAARIAASAGDATAIRAMSNKNVLKNNLPYFVEYCEANCPELYAKAIENAYDTMATLLQAAAKIESVNADVLLGGEGTGPYEDALKDKLLEIINNIALANYEGGSYTDEDIQSAVAYLLDSDGAKAVANIGLRATIGNTFFSHPNRQGCIELYDAVINALENNVTGTEAFVRGLFSTAEDVVAGTVKFGAQFPALLVEKLGEALGIDSSAAAKGLNKVINSAEDIGEYFYNALKIRNADKLDILVSCVVSALDQMQTQVKQLTKVAAKSASIFSAGNKEYYVDADGNMYLDAQGLNKIDDPQSVVIPRVSVVSSVVSSVVNTVKGILAWLF